VSAAAVQRARSRWAPGAQPLADAARVIAQVAEGRSATAALADLGRDADRAAVQAIVLGSLRWYLRLRPAVHALLARGKPAPAPELDALLLAGAHQVEYSQHPPQLTVHAAVDAARILRQPRASGLVNAVLRRFVAERGTLLARLDTQRAVRHAHPQWLVSALEDTWPEAVERILTAGNAHPPLVLRVDRSRIARDAYLEELRAGRLSGEALEWTADAVRLRQAVPAAAIPGLAEGRVSIQDAGAQRAGPLLEVRPGMHVLDACAAPGGKTVHLLELAGGPIDLLALDVDAQRLVRVEENLARTQRQARVAACDLRDLELDSPLVGGRPFDRILLDVPCSATGVIRRHPDIKLLRRASDLASLTRVQHELLQAAFRLLAPGGRLLYCTCSVLPAENDVLVRAFLASESRAAALQLMPAAGIAPGALERSPGMQLLPGSEADTDGFYYACLEKTTVGN
jgi:16S rRNA (cytosine967-C5)-methyltransferase